MRAFFPPLAFGLSLLAVVPGRAESTARSWNEENLEAIRLSFPDPAVHARNLFHVSVAMYDAWAAYETGAIGYLHRETATAGDILAARNEAVSYAAYLVLKHRYGTEKHPLTPVANSVISLAAFDSLMNTLGYPTSGYPTTGEVPSAVGYRAAQTVIGFSAADGANEGSGYDDPTYAPVNGTLDLRFSGTVLNDPNRWQPLEFVTQVAQNGQVLDSTIQEFIGAHWGEVRPFALHLHDGEEVYCDPGAPPQLGGEGDADYKAGVVEVIRYSSLLNPVVVEEVDCSPGAIGNNVLGTTSGTGFSVNPFTGAPYSENMVTVADFGRVLAEFWADGPEFETPPGHWNTLANEVVDHPLFERRFGGLGPELEPLEWDVKMYFLLNAAVHDAAVAAWDCKRYYDYIRPISSIRHTGGLGHSTLGMHPGSYHPDGLPLEDGLIEVVTSASIQFGERHWHLGPGAVGKIAIFAWGGEPLNPQTQFTGAKWILAVDWMPYQRDTFVTPAFAGYISGHSTFSRAAAEILTRLTGVAFFPGGLGTHTVTAGSLDFELGPSQDVELQWATYYDAADQAGISRLYGGIHVPVDDGPGRIVGSKCGIAAWELGVKYFDGAVLSEPLPVEFALGPGGSYRLDWPQQRGFFYKVRSGTSLDGMTDLSPYARAGEDYGILEGTGGGPGMFFQVMRSPDGP